jgi:N-carbamoyl-L-amino-acid hydrolase
VQVVREAGREAPAGLIRAHPELAGKAMVSQTLTAESTHEQGKAGLTDCTPEEFARIQQLNAATTRSSAGPSSWRCAGPRGTGLTRREIIATFAPAPRWPPGTSSSPSACATSTASPRSA